MANAETPVIKLSAPSDITLKYGRQVFADHTFFILISSHPLLRYPYSPNILNLYSMIQKQFADKVTSIVKADPSIIGLAVAGSWLTNEIDEFSDLDLILVTKEKISESKDLMLHYARQFGRTPVVDLFV
jgi:hypothetical protein